MVLLLCHKYIDHKGYLGSWFRNYEKRQCLLSSLLQLPNYTHLTEAFTVPLWGSIQPFLTTLTNRCKTEKERMSKESAEILAVLKTSLRDVPVCKKKFFEQSHKSDTLLT